jgi:predicted PurR-regulated permease PerM
MLKKSRVGHIYEEIIPGLQTFASLIGRAFQAQGCIAIVNAILTWIVIKMLGIENGLFLSVIVFLCSFIPVLGVVLSGAPIAAMAIIQDGGGFMLALWAIMGILIIHFIETSLLNPKIVGTFLHLHPVLVLVILALGEHFFGAWGLLLGLPVAVYIIRIVILDEGLPWEKK